MVATKAYCLIHTNPFTVSPLQPLQFPFPLLIGCCVCSLSTPIHSQTPIPLHYPPPPSSPGHPQGELAVLGLPVCGPAQFRQHHRTGSDSHSGPGRLPALPRVQHRRQGRVLDQEAGPPHPDHWHYDVHKRPAVPVGARGRVQCVDPESSVAATAGSWDLRVPGTRSRRRMIKRMALMFVR